jgi:hypothetical protein
MSLICFSKTARQEKESSATPKREINTPIISHSINFNWFQKFQTKHMRFTLQLPNWVGWLDFLSTPFSYLDSPY